MATDRKNYTAPVRDQLIRQQAELFVAGLYRGRFYSLQDVFAAGARWADSCPTVQQSEQSLSERIADEYHRARTKDARRVLERIMPELKQQSTDR